MEYCTTYDNNLIHSKSLTLISSLQHYYNNLDQQFMHPQIKLILIKEEIKNNKFEGYEEEKSGKIK